MKRWSSLTGVLALMGGLAAPVAAQDVTIEGVWRTKDGLSDYQVAFCGADGTRLCVSLIALRGKADKEKNRPYIGKTIINEAKASGTNRWRGQLKLYGQSADATMAMLTPTTAELSGCAYFVVCDEFDLVRVE